MKLINIGFGNMISDERLLAIVGADSAPIKRMIQDARGARHAGGCDLWAQNENPSF